MAKLYFIYFLLLLLVYCALNCFAHSVTDDTPASNSSELFNEKKVTPLKPKIIDERQQTEDVVTLSETKAFSLVATGEIMVALVEAKNDKKHVNLLAKYIGTKKLTWGEEAIKTIKQNENDNWKIQLAINNEQQIKDFLNVMSSVADVKNNKIYIFAVNCTSTDDTVPKCVTYENVNIIPIIGSISTVQQPPQNNLFTWETKASLKLSQISQFKKKLTDKFLSFPITDAFAFVREGNKIVLFLIDKAKEDEKKKYNCVYV